MEEVGYQTVPLLQSINAKRFRTFGEMALDFVKYQISCFQFTSVVVDIFDRYDIQNSVILLIQFVRIQCMQYYGGIRLFLCACQTTAI
jgi:hypothetical protein